MLLPTVWLSNVHQKLLFRTKYGSNPDDFYDICIESILKKYNEVTDLTYDFLYKPMNDLVVSFINEFGNKPNNRNHYFKFIFVMKIFLGYSQWWTGKYVPNVQVQILSLFLQKIFFRRRNY